MIKKNIQYRWLINFFTSTVLIINMMQAQREKQPFFKPLSNLSTNEMTSPSSLYEVSSNQNIYPTKIEGIFL